MRTIHASVASHQISVPGEVSSSKQDLWSWPLDVTSRDPYTDGPGLGVVKMKKV